MKTRKEFDSIGSIQVPAEKYWGASTERSNKFFNIGKIGNIIVVCTLTKLEDSASEILGGSHIS